MSSTAAGYRPVSRSQTSATEDGTGLGVLQIPEWWQSVWNTVKFTVGSVLLETVLGLAFALITGDDARTARAVARRLGIGDVAAEASPEDKLAAIRRLQAERGRLAYVGDGINDAPALAAADVGIAVGGGTDIAVEAADVVLMSGDLSGVPDAVALSAATMRNIRENLFWAFAYNAALIPVAAGALYPVNGALLSPMLAAGAMALSSVFVVGNALRLRRFRRRRAARGEALA